MHFFFNKNLSTYCLLKVCIWLDVIKTLKLQLSIFIQVSLYSVIHFQTHCLFYFLLANTNYRLLMFDTKNYKAIPYDERGVLDTTLCDKVCQWLEAGQWFSPGTLVSSINKTRRQDITEILFKVALNTKIRLSLWWIFTFLLFYLIITDMYCYRYCTLVKTFCDSFPKHPHITTYFNT